MGLNEEKPGPSVSVSTLQCRRFGRESVSHSQTNWQASFAMGLAGPGYSPSRQARLYHAVGEFVFSPHLWLPRATDPPPILDHVCTGRGSPDRHVESQ